MHNGKQKELDEIRELLRMAAAQTAANARHATEHDREMADIRKELRGYAKEHDREMAEIRKLFRAMIRRIAV